MSPVWALVALGLACCQAQLPSGGLNLDPSKLLGDATGSLTEEQRRLLESEQKATEDALKAVGDSTGSLTEEQRRLLESEQKATEDALKTVGDSTGSLTEEQRRLLESGQKATEDALKTVGDSTGSLTEEQRQLLDGSKSLIDGATDLIKEATQNLDRVLEESFGSFDFASLTPVIRPIDPVLTRDCTFDLEKMKKFLDPSSSEEMGLRQVMTATRKMVADNNCFTRDKLSKGVLCLYPDDPALENTRTLTDTDLETAVVNMKCPDQLKPPRKGKPTALGKRMCKYLLKQTEVSCDVMFTKRRALSKIKAMFPPWCVQRLADACKATTMDDIATLDSTSAADRLRESRPTTPEDLKKLAESEVAKDVPVTLVREARNWGRQDKDDFVKKFADKLREMAKEVAADSRTNTRQAKKKLKRQRPSPVTAEYVDAARPLSASSDDTVKAMVTTGEVIKCFTLDELDKALEKPGMCNFPIVNGTDPLADHPDDKRARICEKCKSTLKTDMPPSCYISMRPDDIDKDLENVADLDDASFKTKIGKFAAALDDMNDKQRNRIVEKAREKVKSLSTITADDLDNLTPVLVKMSPDDIKAKLDTAEKKIKYCEKMGKQKIPSKADNAEKLAYCLKETTTPIAGLGGLLQSLPSTAIPSLDKATVDDLVSTLADYSGDKTTRKAAIDRKKTLTQGGLDSFTGDDLVKCGTLLCNMDEADIIITADKPEAATELPNIRGKMEEMEERLKTFMVDDATRTDMEKCKQTFVPRAIETLIETLGDSTSSGGNRRKRQTSRDTKSSGSTEYGCDVVTAAGAANLNVTQLGMLNASVWTECPDAFSGADNCFTPEQIQAVASSAKASLGFLESWSASQAASLGGVMLGFSGQEISTFNFSSADAADVINAIGAACVSFTTYEQYAEVWAAWKKQGMKHADTLTGSEVAGMSNILCGLNSQDLGFITGGAVEQALSSLGTIECLSLEQKTSLVTSYKKVVAVLPNDTATVGNMGGLLSGYGASFLTELADELWSYIDVEALADISLDSHTIEKIGSLTLEQALSVISSGRHTSMQDSAKKACVLSRREGEPCSTASNPTSAPNSNITTNTTAYNGPCVCVFGICLPDGCTPGTGSNSSASSTVSSAGSASPTVTATTTVGPTSDTTGTKTAINALDKLASKLSVDLSTLTAANIENYLEELNSEKGADLFAKIPKAVYQSETAITSLLERVDSLSEAAKATTLKMIRKYSDVSTLDPGTLAASAEVIDRKAADKMTVEAFEEVVKNGVFRADKLKPAAKRSFGKKGKTILAAAISSTSTKEQREDATRNLAKVMHLVPDVATYTSFVDKLFTDNEAAPEKVKELLMSAELNKKQARYLSKKFLAAESSNLRPSSGLVTKDVAMAAFEKIPSVSLRTVNSSLVKSLDDAAGWAILKMMYSAKRPTKKFNNNRFESDRVPAVIRQIGQNLRNSSGNPIKSASNENTLYLLKGDILSPADAEKVGLGPLCSLGSGHYKDADRTLATAVRKRCKAVANTGDWVIGKAYSVADIRELKADGVLFQTVGKICDDPHELSQAQMEALADKVAQVASSDFTDKEKVKSYACVLPYMNMTSLEKATNVEEMCYSLAEKSMAYKLPATLMSELLDFCLNSSVVSLRKMASPDETRGMPTLISAMNKTQFESYISCDTAVAAADVLVHRLGGDEVAKLLYDCVKAKKINLNDDGVMGYMVHLADQFATADWDSINNEQLCGLREEYAKVATKQTEMRNFRQSAGYQKHKDTALGRFDITSKKATVMDKLTTAESSTACTGAASGRRRRATSTLTCLDVAEESEMLAARTASDMALLTATEFKDCVDDLGTLLLPPAHRAAFATTAKTAYGATSTWDAETTLTMGGLMSGLTKADLQALNPQALDLDAMTTIGQYGNWSDPEKSTVLVEHYITNSVGSAGSLTTADLNAMNKMVGGLKTNHIQAIPAASYCGAAADIGMIDTMEETQQTAWATHAKTCYGSDISLWTAANIRETGSVIGGLPDADIGKLVKEHIEEIEPAAIRLFPARKFATLTVTQLQFMNSAQAQAVTDSQMASLSPEQRNVLNAKLGTVGDDMLGGNNGAGLLEASLIIILTTVAAGFIRI